MSPTEEWRPVPGFPGYEVSDLGRVLSRRRRSPRILRGLEVAGTRRYPAIGLYRDGKLHLWPTHRIVTLAFFGPRPEGMVTRHLDGNTCNNALTNLAYGTPAENNADVLRHGTHAQANQTHCKRNHEFTPENTYRSANGKRQCRACKSLWWRENAARAAA